MPGFIFPKDDSFLLLEANATRAIIMAPADKNITALFKPVCNYLENI